MSHSQFAAFTIVAHNYLPRARVLGESFRRVHPDAAFFIVVIDHPLKVRLRQEAEPELVPIVDIDFGAEGFQHMAVAYNVTEFATAIKPFALRHFLADFECVLYIDPDVEIYAPLDPIVEATVEHGISLTPHCLQPIARDGAEPSEIGIMAAGIFNLGYIGVARQGSAFVEWWAERLRRDSIVDPANHLFTDQRWIDISVPIFRPYIEASPAYNVAYWNLDQRPLRRRDDTWYAGEVPLTFLHFSGFNPGPPLLISQHRRDLDEAALGPGAELFHDYATSLQRADLAGTQGWPYAFGQFRDGRPVPFVLRQFHREVLEPCEGDPFECPSERYAELAEGAAGTAEAVTRFMAFLLERNEGVARHFRLDEPPQRAAYWRWFLAEAGTYFNLPRWLVDTTAGAHAHQAAEAAVP